MNQTEARKLWVEALRSDKYKQGQACLRSGDRFCCLGVACDLYAKHEGGLDWGRTTRKGHVFGNGSVYHLPLVVRKWLGLSRVDGSITGSTSLASCNDTGASFKGIADLIECNNESLFNKGTNEPD